MCVAVPARIIAVGEAAGVSRPARVAAGGVEREIDLALVPGATVGDYVIVHAGYAVASVAVDDARRTLALLGVEPPGR